MRHVLVTGASRGFGRLIALALAQRGWCVHATVRELGRAGTLLEAAEAANVTESSLRIHAMDQDDAASIEAGAAEVLRQTGGGLDALVLNAGIAAAGCFEDAPEEQVRRVMETNFFGTLAVARAFLPALRVRGGARMLVMSSDAGLYGTPGLSVYSASKHAIEGWAESVALELAPFGVRVVILEPGNFKTDIWDGEFTRDPASPYAALSAKLEHAGRKLADAARNPDEVTTAAIRALESRRPRLRYRVGPDAKVMHTLRRVAPDEARLALLARVAGTRDVQAAT
jgi:NAD(P)-dependent dehydrogenase (short-subunit alcohol dehydrogenase family)